MSVFRRQSWTPGSGRYAQFVRTTSPYCNDHSPMAGTHAKRGDQGAHRAATAECVNALARNRCLKRLLVRGLKRVKGVALLRAAPGNKQDFISCLAVNQFCKERIH